MNEQEIARARAEGVRWDSHGNAIVPEPDPADVLLDAAEGLLKARADYEAGEIGDAAMRRAIDEYDAKAEAVEIPPADPGPGGGGPRNAPLTPADLAAAQRAGDWDAVDQHNKRWLDQLRKAQNDPTAAVQYGPQNN